MESSQHASIRTKRGLARGRESDGGDVNLKLPKNGERGLEKTSQYLLCVQGADRATYGLHGVFESECRLDQVTLAWAHRSLNTPSEP